MARVVGMCTVLAMLLGVPCTANDQQDHYQEGIAHYMDGKIRLAQLSFSEAALAQPGHFESHFNLGLCHKRLKEPSAAVAAYHAALNVRPSDAEVYFNIGNAHTDADELSAAEASYQDCIALAPEAAVASKAHFNIGNHRRQAGDTLQAAKHYTRALQLDPHHAGAAHNNRMLQTTTPSSKGSCTAPGPNGNCDSAVPDKPACTANVTDLPTANLSATRAAVASCAQDGQMMAVAAARLMALQEAKGAMQAAQIACELAPDSPTSWLAQGTVLRSEGQLTLAKVSLQKALVLAPAMGAVYSELGMVHLREASNSTEQQPVLKQAAWYFETAAGMLRGAEQCMVLEALASMSKGNETWTDARDAYVRAMQACGEQASVGVYTGLADVLLKLDDPEWSGVLEEALKAALQLNPLDNRLQNEYRKLMLARRAET